MGNFSDKLASYVAGVVAKNKEFLGTHGYRNDDFKIEVEDAPKYVRVWRVSGGQKSIHTFINKETGDILKPASYKSPAKNGVRGNLFDASNGLAGVTWHSTAYLR